MTDHSFKLGLYDYTNDIENLAILAWFYAHRNSLLAKKTTPNFWLPVRSLKPRCVIMFLWFFSNKIPFGTIGTFPSIIIKIHAQNFWGHWQNFLMIFESVNCYHPVWCTLRFPKRVSPEETPDVCSHIPWYEVMQWTLLHTDWVLKWT